MSAGRLLLNEFQWDKCLPTLEDKNAIFYSMWDWVSMKAFLIYRIFIGLFAIGYIIFDICWETLNFYDSNIRFWFVYATNWAFIIFSVTMLILAINSIIKYFRPNYVFPNSYCHLVFVIYTISCVSALTVGLVYWVALYAENGLMRSIEAQCKHTIPSIIILFDILFNRIILQLAHVIYPLTCGIVYVIFNFIYYQVGGVRYDYKPYVYESIDWTYPKSALTGCMIILVFTVLLHGLLFLISFFKIVIKLSSADVRESINDCDESKLVK